MSNTSTCKFCQEPLDMGDIFVVLCKKFQGKSYDDLMKIASYYGWSPTNRKSFTKEISFHFQDAHISLCPNCQSIWPSSSNEHKTEYPY